MCKSCTGNSRQIQRARRQVLFVQFGKFWSNRRRRKEGGGLFLASAVAIESAESDAGARQLDSLGSTDSTAE